jgi:anti-sigma B factor antagonist
MGRCSGARQRAASASALTCFAERATRGRSASFPHLIGKLPDSTPRKCARCFKAMRPVQRPQARRTPFDCIVERVGDAVYVRPVGELDVACASALRTTLDALRIDSTPRLVIDLRFLTFLDCRGLGVILRACSMARRDGSVLQLIPGVGVVDRLFDLTDVRRHFDLTVGTVKRP